MIFGDARPRHSDQGFIARLVGLTAVFVLFYDVFGGVARYVLADAGALYVNNIPGILAVVFFVIYWSRFGARRKIEPFMIGVAVWTGFYLFYAMIDGLVPMQSVFGFYIWALFLLGILVCVYEQETFVLGFMPILWACAVTGVVLNDYVRFPWVGMSYEAHGMQMDMSAEWWAEGVDRLAGFSRMNFSAASSILFGLVYILASRRFGITVKVLCYAISGWALYLTTSKTEIFVHSALPVAVAVYAYVKFVMHRSLACYQLVRVWQIGLVALVVLLPLTLSAGSLTAIPIIGFFSSDSIVDRIQNTWPDAFHLFLHSGNVIFGRGMGGIGMSQLTGEPFWLTPGDNLFVYVFVTGGIFLSAPLFWAFFRSQKATFLANPSYFEIIALMNFCMLGIGLTSGVIEGPTPGLLLGLLVARAYIKPGFAKKGSSV